MVEGKIVEEGNKIYSLEKMRDKNPSSNESDL
jgi:hypothetical protein